MAGKTRIVFDAPGSATDWVVPPLVNRMDILAIGGGGGKVVIDYRIE